MSDTRKCLECEQAIAIRADGKFVVHAYAGFPVECPGSQKAAYASADHDPHGDLDAILNDPGALVDGDPGALVLATSFELLRVLEGRELTFAAEGGARVRIRLYNKGELLAAQKAAADDLPGPDPGMTRARATELCRPIDVEAIARMRRAP